MASATPAIGADAVSHVLYLIRHGRSDFDSSAMSATARGDQWDPPLSEEGRRQAELLANRLQLMELATRRRRTARRSAGPRETVAPYADAAGVDVVFDDELIEAHIGGWEGLPFEEIVASDAELVHRIRNQQAIWSRAPGGESERDFRATRGGGGGRDRHARTPIATSSSSRTAA